MGSNMDSYVVIRRGTWDTKAQVKEHVGNLQYVKEHGFGFLCGHGERNQLATCSSEGTCRIYTVCEGIWIAMRSWGEEPASYMLKWRNMCFHLFR
jgi:hypothetical protein